MVGRTGRERASYNTSLLGNQRSKKIAAEALAVVEVLARRSSSTFVISPLFERWCQNTKSPGLRLGVKSRSSFCSKSFGPEKAGETLGGSDMEIEFRLPICY